MRLYDDCNDTTADKTKADVGLRTTADSLDSGPRLTDHQRLSVLAPFHAKVGIGLGLDGGLQVHCLLLTQAVVALPTKAALTHSL